MKKVLCFFTVNPQYTEFGIPELKSLLHSLGYPHQVLFQHELKGVEIKHEYQINNNLFKYYPFVVINVPEFEKHRHFFERVCRQSVMVYKMILLISEGDSYEQLIANRDEQLLIEHCRKEDDLVVCDFNSRNRVIDREQQKKKIHAVLAGLSVRGHVAFKQPQYHEWYQFHHLKPSEKTLKHVYFGIELSCNMIATAKFNNPFELNKRIYLGPTSTDNNLAFLMCNQALVEPGSIVIDPFVGTGGLLIPPASKGAITFGSDLDIRVLNGYAVGRINKKSPYYDVDKKFELFTPKINLNFQQYGLALPNIIRIDSTKLTLRATDFFDAIITDPPYGIRAMSRTVTKKVEKEEIQSQQTKKEEKIEQIPVQKVQEKEQQIDSQEEVSPELQIKQKEEQSVGMTQQEKNKIFRREKRKMLKEKKRERKKMLPEEQKQFQKQLMEKMNKERVQQWQKYDRGKIEATEREQIFNSLLAFGKKYLRKDGRMVFLYPIYEQQEYKGALSMPEHDGFLLIDLSENKMSKGNSRILVTLQKQ